MPAFKNLIFQILILTILAALATCSPADRVSKEVFHLPKFSPNNMTIDSFAPNYAAILDEAQFKASGLSLITSEPTAQDPDGWVACETTNASPWIWNTRDLAWWFSQLHGWNCCNVNGNGGGCTHLGTTNDASTALCGNLGCINCAQYGGYLYKLVDYCTRDNKAGGVVFLHQGSHIVVY
ncbi:hypothetical protein HOY80DRAFT_1137742 [Tuber brumale]|nr:hypothetical protein HOY80DRAFT_1137742 [Tuber brumale]